MLRGIELAFVVAWFLMPFSGAYYPIEILPIWGQRLSQYLPMSYIFSCMRDYVQYHDYFFMMLIKGYCLSVIYALIAIVMFNFCFHFSKHRGLARLTD